MPGVDLEDTREAHVLLPMESRIVFIPRVALGMGTAARCPDEVVDASVDQWHGWSRARFSMLTNHLTECESEDEDECMSGCVWEARTDYVVLVSASGTTAAVFSANLAFREPNAEVPWEWLERYAVLPPGVLFANEEGLYVYGCGPTRAVRLPP